ncbi:ferritin-like domain-containing protein [Priestia abyssalis]|uniref:ferritin-like domain-containing protein n=1 Tax=Priestia abyssalis TaxID=1221450 RepID=UPI000995B622|nr:DUF2202 domain-containing protein [Priestia abyssalis]
MKTSIVQKHVCFVAVFAAFMLCWGSVSFAGALPEKYGAKGALSDSSITLDEALTYAIQDEFLAQARYDSVIEKFGPVRPFTQIKAAEQRHIEALLPLFKQYNVIIPVNDAARFINIPQAAEDALEAGVSAEINNIAMYDKLLKIPDFPPNVENVFSRLGHASRNHLSALQAALR